MGSSRAPADDDGANWDEDPEEEAEEEYEEEEEDDGDPRGATPQREETPRVERESRRAERSASAKSASIFETDAPPSAEGVEAHKEHARAIRRWLLKTARMSHKETEALHRDRKRDALDLRDVACQVGPVTPPKNEG